MFDYIAIRMVDKELSKARESFPAFCSEHEGYAVILEELDELWEAVRLNQADPLRMGKCTEEATQVAAMAMRFLIDRC